MKKIWKQITEILLVSVFMLTMLPAQAATAEINNVSVNSKKVTMVYYPGNSSSSQIGIGQIWETNKNTNLKNLKSSNPSVVTVKTDKWKFDERAGGGYMTDIFAVAKKPGTATVSFKAGSGTYKVTVIVKKYQDPVSYIKIGSTKISASKFKSSRTYNLNYSKYANKKVKITFKAAKGWKVNSTALFLNDYISYAGSTKPSYQPLKSGQTFTVKCRKPTKKFTPCITFTFTNKSTGVMETVAVNFK